MSIKILIVDDHDDFRTTIKNHLMRQEHFLTDISEANSGETGILKALREKPDVVLMDIRLPNINGIESAGRIKARIPECKIIVLTMFETAAFRKVFKSKDIDAYIGKSEIYDKLIPTIQKNINTRKSR